MQVLIRTLNHAARCESAVVGARVHVRCIEVTRKEGNRNRLCAGCADCSRLIDVLQGRSAVLTVQLVAVVIKVLNLYANLISRIASVGVLNLHVLVRHNAGQHAVRVELELVVCCQGIRAVNACVRVVRVTAHDLHAVIDKAGNGRRCRGDRLLRILGICGRRLDRGTGLIHVLRAESEALVGIDHIEVANGQVIIRHNAADNISAAYACLFRAGAGTGGLTELTLFIILYNDRADLIARHSR